MGSDRYVAFRQEALPWDVNNLPQSWSSSEANQVFIAFLHKYVAFDTKTIVTKKGEKNVSHQFKLKSWESMQYLLKETTFKWLPVQRKIGMQAILFHCLVILYLTTLLLKQDWMRKIVSVTKSWNWYNLNNTFWANPVQSRSQITCKGLYTRVLSLQYGISQYECFRQQKYHPYSESYSHCETQAGLTHKSESVSP